MQVIIFDNADDVGEYAADMISRGVELGEIKVLGIATGSSPQPIYNSLVKKRTPQLGSISAFALDEYVGLPYSHPESYHAVVQREVTGPLGLDPSRVHVPDGAAQDIVRACADYERDIAAAGGIDLQILGIGASGHIGFNEPTSSLASRTRIKTLTDATRADNARFFDSVDEVPRHCITQGLGTIMEAKNILLIAQGKGKAHAIAQAIEGPLTSMCPASLLQMHPRVTVVLDPEAASELRLADYYRRVFEDRPTEQ
ncbi:glucosamine-6-phosphate deaminase [Frigoribacterium sp. CG_9.8]|uniref:glucosamine-6-phosphate deaminase n=1 Tax=Frigoribacterium sp. CG_9.8 TaxID=2787733 RepID=UPI0018C97FF8|nr:glucosamine-6-phosphate deaminase [Frigoribacterium sp. CG_9.8]MBG6107388.1 glucosamine-6-phosphate deaminase [Frigoribacterium sp. CG_9.8]